MLRSLIKLGLGDLLPFLNAKLFAQRTRFFNGTLYPVLCHDSYLMAAPQPRVAAPALFGFEGFLAFLTGLLAPRLSLRRDLKL